MVPGSEYQEGANMLRVDIRGLAVAAASAVALLSASGASASTVTQLIHFDDIGNGPGLNPIVDDTYTTRDSNFSFTPVNEQSSIQCAPKVDEGDAAGDLANSANGKCVIETRQGSLIDMTRNTGDGTFSLDSFYGYFTGSGTGQFITVTGYDAMDMETDSFSFIVGMTYDNVYGFSPNDFILEDPPQTLAFGEGYIFDVSSFDFLDGVSRVSFTTSSNSQFRVDCVVATFSGTTSEPRSGFDAACGLGDDPGNPEVVPLPAAGWMLIAGVGGLLAMKRRRKAA